MKRFLRFAHCLTLLCGGIGIGLMLWLRSAGPDQRGLYPDRHPAWMALTALSVGVMLLLWRLCAKAGSRNSYRVNFPPSLPAAIGYILVGSSLISVNLSLLAQGQWLEMFTAVLGFAGSCVLFYGGFCRCAGIRSPFSLHALPCLFFSLLLFCKGKSLGAETQISVYLYDFLATLTTAPACYWLWSFEVEKGNRSKCLFWCLAAIYCNLIACVSSQQGIFQLTVALWLLTALPRLKYTPQRLRPQLTMEQPAAQDWPTPPDENVQAQVASHTPAVQDVDAILEQILQEFGTEQTP